MGLRTFGAKYAGWCRSADGGCGRNFGEGESIAKLTISGKARYFCAPCAQVIADGGRVAPPAKETEGQAARVAKFAAFKPSTYQAAVRDAVKASKQHLVVLAVAGSGKTTTLEWLLYAVARAVLGLVAFLAFNKSIRKELAARLKGHPSNPDVRTIHSAGLVLCCTPAWDRYRVQLKDVPDRLEVSYSLAGEVCERLWSTEGPSVEAIRSCDLAGPVVRLVTLARQTLSTWEDDDLARLVDRHSVELNGAEGDLPEVFKRTRDLRDALVAEFKARGRLDGAGMVWLPYHLDLAPRETFRTVFVDEVQDLSAGRVKLAMRLAGRTGRIIAVGDSSQAIYGFAGADTESIANLKAELASTPRGVKVLRLDLCYRCPKAVIRLLKRMGLHSTIEALPGAPEGIIESIPEQGWTERVKADDDMLGLCRTNAPLVAPFFALIRRGVPARIQGRDFGAGLIALARRCSWKRDDGSILSMLSRLKAYEGKQNAKLRAAGRDAQVQTLADRCEVIAALCDGVDTVKDLCDRIKQTFRDDGDDRVVFSTVHKAKGLEADTVYILRPDLMPGPWASQPWERVQERNLMYVAYTRTKRALYFVGGPVPGGEDSGEAEAIEEAIAKGGDDDLCEVCGVTPASAGARMCDRCATPESDSEPYVDGCDYCEKIATGSYGGVHLCEDHEPKPTPAPGPVKRSALPVLPSRGDGVAVAPTMGDWERIRDLYIAAGLRAELRNDIAIGTRYAWKQWALLIGTDARGPVVRVSTTIDIRTGKARAKDANAVDCARVNSAHGAPMKGSRRKTLRTTAWDGRILQKINGTLVDAGAAV